eukprot:scaffold5036_cov155-Pinguiococcus_pyrenoidosus.AAC.4
MEIITLLSLQNLCQLGVKDDRRLSLETLWLVYRCEDAEATETEWRAAPLCPRMNAKWKADHRMEMRVSHFIKGSAVHERLNDFMSQLLTKLEVLSPFYGYVFDGVLWEGSDGREAHEISMRTGAHFKEVKGFQQRFWVHQDDFLDFRFDQLQTVFRNDLERVWRDIKSQIGAISIQFQAVRELQIEKSSKIQQMLMTLVRGAKDNGQLPPRFVWVFPVKQERSLVRPSSWFQDKLCIKCLCDVSLKEGDGEGFVIERPREFIRRCLPYIRFSLAVLQIAFATGRLVGFPLPVLDDVCKALGSERWQALAYLVAALDNAADFCAETQAEEHASQRDEGFKELLSLAADGEDKEEDTRMVDEEMLQKLRQVSEKHFHAMRTFLDEKFAGWQRECGLVFTPADDGTFAWVHPSMILKYQAEGASALVSLSKDQEQSSGVDPRVMGVEEAKTTTSVGVERITPSARKGATFPESQTHLEMDGQHATGGKRCCRIT